MAYHLARVDDKEYQKYLYERALAGNSARHIQALVDNYKLKVLKGEWEWFVKKFNNSVLIRGLDEKLLIELSEKCKILSKKLQHFKLLKLSALAEVLAKEIFIAEATRLRKELRLLDNQLKGYLSDKGYKSVEKIKLNEVFEIPVKEMKNRKTARGTIPRKILMGIGVKKEDLVKGTYFQVKIVGIKRK